MTAEPTKAARKGRAMLLFFLALMTLSIGSTLLVTHGPVALRRHVPAMGGVTSDLHPARRLEEQGFAIAFPANFLPVQKDSIRRPDGRVPLIFLARRGLYGPVSCLLVAGKAPGQASPDGTLRLVHDFRHRDADYAIECSGRPEESAELREDLGRIVASLTFS